MCVCVCAVNGAENALLDAPHLTDDLVLLMNLLMLYAEHLIGHGTPGIWCVLSVHTRSSILKRCLISALRCRLKGFVKQ